MRTPSSPARRAAWICLCFLACGIVAQPAHAADEHKILGVDGPDALRIDFHGLPIRVQLANLTFQDEAGQKDAEKFLRSQITTGTLVRVLLEADLPSDGKAAPLVQILKGTTHLNVEMVKRGFAVSDGRSKKYSRQFQTAQMDAMTKKRGVWSREKAAPVVAQAPPKPDKPVPPRSVATKPAPAQPVVQATPSKTPPAPRDEPSAAPDDYHGPVVADLNGQEYHLPGSRFAKTIPARRLIRYTSPQAAERAGKAPSPYSLPGLARAHQARAAKAGTATDANAALAEARKAHEEALDSIRKARQLSGNNNTEANKHWKHAAGILMKALDKLTPVADAHPNNAEIQSLAEQMTMNLYSANKYQTL